MELLLKTKIIFMYLIYPDYEMDDFDFFEFFVLCPTCWASITTHRNLLRGETYVIEVPKGWKRPSAVHSCNDEPLKRVNGKYETTKFMRVYSKRKDRCGAVLTIMEIQRCASFQEIFKEDSIWASTDTTQVKVIYKSVNSKNGVKKMAFTSYKAERHPETNELSALQKAEWYLQGRENVYYISFTSCSLFLELLPQIKDIVASLKEL